jgi:hypothetical protein
MNKVIKVIIRSMQQLGSFGRSFRIRFGSLGPPVLETAVANIAHESRGKTLPQPRRTDLRAARSFVSPDVIFRNRSSFRSMILDVQPRFNRVSSSDQNFFQLRKRT